MNEYDATEITYKNGYKQAAREIFAEIEPWLLDYRNNFCSGLQLITFIRELKKKYAEGENNG